MATFKKGQRVNVNHSRSGKWVGIVTRDFDTEKEEWYPINLDQDRDVIGANTVWHRGDSMPARNTLCTITPTTTPSN